PAQSGKVVPRFAAVFRFEQRGIFHPCVNVIGIVKRRFQMPDTLEFPRMLRAVIPLMRRDWFPGLRRSVIKELVTLAFGHAIRTFPFFWAAAGRHSGFATII